MNFRLQSMFKRIIERKSYFSIFIIVWFIVSLLWLSNLSTDEEIIHFKDRFASIENEQKVHCDRLLSSTQISNFNHTYPISKLTTLRNTNPNTQS